MFVFTCPRIGDVGVQSAGLTSSSDVPTCTTDEGLWVHVSELETSTSWATTLTLTDAAELIGASLLAVAVAWGFRVVYDFTINRG